MGRNGDTTSMVKANDNYLKLPGSYLFSTIGKKVREYSAAHPEAKIIRLGIGDVTQPLAPAIIESLHSAVDEMADASTFKGYAPDLGYEFLRNAIAENDYKARGCDISADEIFVSDGAKCDCSNIQEIFSLDNKIAVCDPVYPVYVDSNVMAGRTGVYDAGLGTWSDVIYMPCTADNGFAPELPKQQPDLIYLCFPNNPTGATITKAQLQEWFKAHELEIATSYLDKMCDIFKVHKHEQLFLGIGQNKIKLTDDVFKTITGRKQTTGDRAGWRKFVPSFMGGDSWKSKKEADVATDNATGAKSDLAQQHETLPGTMIGADGKYHVLDSFNKKQPVFISESTIGHFVFDDCCHVIPGDDVLGYVDEKGRIKIHQRDCKVAVRLKSSYGNRIVDAKWDMHKQMLFEASIHARGIDRIGLLNDVTRIFSSELQLNIKDVNIKCHDGIFDAHFSFNTHDREEVQHIMDRLKQVSGLQEVARE